MTILSRRAFLKSSVAAACAACASQMPLPVAAKPQSDEELATLIDIRKCIGCEACVEACRESNADKYPEPEKPFPKMYPNRVKAADWSDPDKREVRDRLTPYNWLFIQEAGVEIEGEETYLTFPRRCMHCQNPPCADLCPWGAARKLKNGISLINANACLGGQKCKAVCPWKIPERQTGVGLYLDLMPSLAGNGVMYKCDRCYNRIAQGELPACIEVCPEDVQMIGPRREILAEARRLEKEEGVYLYGEKENGGTNTIYVSPVPFDQINKAIAKGPGRPHMGPVKNQMADAENMTKAVFIAPIAGLLAAAGRMYNILKTKDNGSGDRI